MRYIKLLLPLIRVLVPVSTVLVIATACGVSDEVAPESWVDAELIAVSHPNGLVLELPQGLYLVEASAEGFRIRPERTRQMRSPFEIRIEVSGEISSDDAWPLRRVLREQPARYRLETHGEGSGGTEYVLHAWQVRGDAALMLWQRVQVEYPGQPDFRDGWAVLGAARLQ